MVLANFRLRFLVLFFCLVLLPAIVLAQDDEPADDPGDGPDPPITAVSSWISYSIVNFQELFDDPANGWVRGSVLADVTAFNASGRASLMLDEITLREFSYSSTNDKVDTKYLYNLFDMGWYLPGGVLIKLQPSPVRDWVLLPIPERVWVKWGLVTYRNPAEQGFAGVLYARFYFENVRTEDLPVKIFHKVDGVETELDESAAAWGFAPWWCSGVDTIKIQPPADEPLRGELIVRIYEPDAVTLIREHSKSIPQR